MVDEDIRKQITCGSRKFKKVYSLHNGSERIFSKLLELSIQDPTLRGSQAISTHYTIAHITYVGCLNGCLNWK
ncbi:MAG: hypothetical protein GX240_00415 [Candidatus Atribacteria bacterium]|nr:hypothetical protein [Candidatus Atribacteria bacterium]